MQDVKDSIQRMEMRTNLEIVGKISWSGLVVDTGAGTRLILISDARI
jgi:hypothetical protein